MELGKLIQQYIDDNNLSQREFAKQCGDISHAYISYIIKGVTPRGKKPVLTIEKIKAIANGMGIDAHDLIALIDDKIAWSAAAELEAEQDEFYEELQILRDNPETRSTLRQMKNMTPEQVRKMNDWIASMQEA